MRAARKVAQDHTVSWEGNRWGVPREEVCAGLRGAPVEIERRLDGSHWLRFRNRYLRLRHCPEPAPRAVSPSGLRPPVLTANQQSRVYKSAPPNHPWRTFQYGRKPDIIYFALTDEFDRRIRRSPRPNGLQSGVAERKVKQKGILAHRALPFVVDLRRSEREAELPPAEEKIQLKEKMPISYIIFRGVIHRIGR